MSFKFAREDVFILLSSMGISLPTTTKISDEDLNKRLIQALDAAQCLRTVIDTTPFIPTDHPLWPTDGIQNLVGATNKMSFKEMIASRFRLVAAPGPSTTVPSCDKRDTFQEMRNAVMGIAQGLNDGHDFCLTEQTGELKSCGVYFRVRVKSIGFILPVWLELKFIPLLQRFAISIASKTPRFTFFSTRKSHEPKGNLHPNLS